MSAALAEIRARFGSIDWLVHAAGLPGSSLMQTKTVDEAESVLAPKVLGTLLLDRHFRDEPLQLMVLCSSLNAVFGEPGTSDYSAANAYLDAFAAAHSRPDRPIVAIGWDAWREVGMAAKAAMSWPPGGEGCNDGLLSRVSRDDVLARRASHHGYSYIARNGLPAARASRS